MRRILSDLLGLFYPRNGELFTWREIIFIAAILAIVLIVAWYFVMSQALIVHGKK